jgi:hypothetical protein
MSRKLVEADEELHRTGYLDVEKLHRSLLVIRGESDTALRSRGLQAAIPQKYFSLQDAVSQEGPDLRHPVQLGSDLSPPPLLYRFHCDRIAASTGSMGNVLLHFTSETRDLKRVEADRIAAE